MRWLARRLVGDADRRAIENDLRELHELKRRDEGSATADRWLRQQQQAYGRHLLADRVTSAFQNRSGLMGHIWRDFRHSVRSLIRTPALSATIVLTVGIGLGATTAMLGVVQAVLVNPLPYADADSIYWIYTDNAPFRFRFSVVDYRALEADHPSFSSIAAYQTSRATLRDADSTEDIAVRSVTGSYFPMLGQKPALGRLFDPSDDKGGDRPAVLTLAYWHRRFGGDPSILGRTLSLNGTPHTVVGVLESAVGPFEQNTDVFTAERWPEPRRKGPFLTMAIARLKPGVTTAAAAETLHATNRRLFPIWKSSYQDEKATWGLQDLKSRVVGDIGATLLLVLAAVGCVLLIACANAINLLVARGLQRSRELAIRGALGATRGRLLQQVLMESGTLAVAAALFGLAVAAGAMQLIRAYGGTNIPRLAEIGLSGSTLAWLVVLTAAAAVMIGLVPAFHSSRLRMDDALRSGTRSTTDGPTARRVRRALVAFEFALATPLIVAAVLVLVSLDRLNRVPVGVDTARTISGAVALNGPRYAEEAQRAAFWRTAVERLAALPGVEDAAIADSRPPVEAGQRNNFDLLDKPTPPGQNQPISTWVGVSPSFFKTVGLHLERGRLLDDRSLDENVVVVDRAWANRFYPGEDAVGRRFRSGGCTTCDPNTVVGVVSDVKWQGLDAESDGTVYFPLVDVPNGFLTLRATGDPAMQAAALQRTMKELDPGLALTRIATGDELVSTSLSTPRYLTVLVGTFALTALILSVVGIYGVMAYFVQQHWRDLGIRLALGGEPSAIRRMIVFQGVKLVAIGVVVGVAASLFTARLMQSLLFGVSATNLAALIGVPAALVGVAIVACVLPARRAARVDPVEILREA